MSKAIREVTGYDRKSVRKYLLQPDSVPVFPQPPQTSKLDGFQPVLEERLQAGVWNARVLLRELHERGYQGGYTTVTDWLRPQRAAAAAVAVRRFETPPGHQAQVDRGHLGSLEWDSIEPPVVGLHLHAGLQPDDDGGGGAEPEAGNVAADAREAFQQLVPRRFCMTA